MLGLEDVAAHIDAGRALVDCLKGHLQCLALGQFLPPAITIGTGQAAVTFSKSGRAIVGLDHVGPVPAQTRVARLK